MTYSVTIPGHIENLAVMNQPIQYGCGNSRIAKKFSPLLKAFIRSDNHRCVLVKVNIHVGEIGLPDIQRPFVWPRSKVRDLFDSMYRGFPIGYLLFWENGFSGVHRTIGVEGKQKVPRLLIVDGQQRLTSLYAVIKAAKHFRT